MPCTKTQAEQLFVHLRRKAMTYGDMEALRISTCPWKRVAESKHLLKDGEQLVKGFNKQGLVTFKVVQVKEVCHG